METNGLQEYGMRAVCNSTEWKSICRKVLAVAVSLLINDMARAELSDAGDDAEISSGLFGANPLMAGSLTDNDNTDNQNSNGLLVELKVYPNPIYNGQLIIDKGEVLQRERVEVYDMGGLLKGVYFITEKQTVINLSGLPHGLYIVRVGNRIARVVKQ